MKTLWLTLLLISCVVCSSLTSGAQDSDFQTGKILSVEKGSPSTTSSAHRTDAPLPSNVTEYSLAIQLNGRVYTCRAQTHSGLSDWTQGQEIQAKVEGKVMSIKRPHGEVERFPITASKND